MKSENTIKLSIENNDDIQVNWNGQDLSITPTLPLAKMMAFVSNVVDTCFEEDGTYIPEIRDMLIKCGVLEMYAGIKLEDDVSVNYDIVYKTDILDTVMNNINIVQFNEIRRAIDEKINYKIKSRLDIVNRRISELEYSINDFMSSISDTLKDFDSKDLEKVIGAVANGNFDYGKLAEEFSKNSK